MYLQLNLYINWLRRNQSFEIRETKKKHIFFVKFSHFLRSLHPEYIIFYFFFYKDIYISHIKPAEREGINRHIVSTTISLFVPQERNIKN